MAKPKKNKNKQKINLTLRGEQRNKLEQMAAIEKRSEQQGFAFAKTIAEAMNLKVDADKPADREKFRRALLELVPESKGRKQKRRD